MNKKKILAVICFTLEIIVYQSIIIIFFSLINFHSTFKNPNSMVWFLGVVINFIHLQWLYIYTYKKTCLSLRLLKFKINYNPNDAKLPPIYIFLLYYIYSYYLIIPEKLYFILYAKVNYLIYHTEIFSFNIIKYITSNIIFLNPDSGDGFFTVKIFFMITWIIYFIIQAIRKKERLTVSMRKLKIDLVEMSSL